MCVCVCGFLGVQYLGLSPGLMLTAANPSFSSMWFGSIVIIAHKRNILPVWEEGAENADRRADWNTVWTDAGIRLVGYYQLR